MASLVVLSGLSWSAPDFRILIRRQNTLKVAPLSVQRWPAPADPIKVAEKETGSAASTVASSTVSGAAIHIAVDNQTPEIRAVEVTSSAMGDAPVFARFAQPDCPARRDRPCGRRRHLRHTRLSRCHRCAGAVAIIPPRKNTRLWKPTTDGATARNTSFDVQVSWARVLAKVGRVSPSQSGGSEDELHQAEVYPRCIKTKEFGACHLKADLRKSADT